jgi:hypothetical protein
MKIPNFDNIDLAIISLVIIALMVSVLCFTLKINMTSVLSNIVTGIAGLAVGKQINN